LNWDYDIKISGYLYRLFREFEKNKFVEVVRLERWEWRG